MRCAGSRDAGARRYRALRKRGKSKNGRGDVPQVVVGLAVTRDGFPVRHWVFAGLELPRFGGQVRAFAGG